METINERIKLIRKINKLTQKEMADKLNLSKATVESYEYGRINVTDRTIKDICEKFGIDEFWLRTGDGEMFADLDREMEIANITKQMLDADDDDFRYKMQKLLYEMDEEQISLLKEMAIKLAEGEI